MDMQRYQSALKDFMFRAATSAVTGLVLMDLAGQPTLHDEPTNIDEDDAAQRATLANRLQRQDEKVETNSLRCWNL